MRKLGLSGVLDLDAEASALAAILTKDGIHQFLPDGVSRRGCIFEVSARLERQNGRFRLLVPWFTLGCGAMNGS